MAMSLSLALASIALNEMPNSTILIVIAAAGVSLLFSLGRRYLTDVERSRRIRAELAAFDREWRQAILSGNKAKQEKLRRKKKRMDELRVKMMASEMKPTLLFMIPLLGIYYGVSTIVGFDITVAISPIPLPLITPTLGIDLATRLSFFWWYIISSIALSGVIARALGATID